MRNIDFIMHDIGHCDKDICPLANTCYRYLMYKHAIMHNIDYITMIIIDDKDMGDQCDCYWKISNPENLNIK